MTDSTPQRPESLPPHILNHRNRFELIWERNKEIDDKKVLDAREWAKAQLVELYVAQRLGARESDSDYMDRVDDLYNTIRSAFTMREIIYGFLSTIHDEAREEAAKQVVAFQAELKQIFGPSV